MILAGAYALAAPALVWFVISLTSTVPPGRRSPQVAAFRAGATVITVMWVLNAAVTMTTANLADTNPASAASLYRFGMYFADTAGPLVALTIVAATQTPLLRTGALYTLYSLCTALLHLALPAAAIIAPDHVHVVLTLASLVTFSIWSTSTAIGTARDHTKGIATRSRSPSTP
ncbi:hypothetical protein [Streptomyces osmaniensis]|nr:hypothetical protein KJK32_46135 [Streptomyces sp. JCM17656]